MRGSSPRMRGILIRCAGGEPVRFIPTYAGNTRVGNFFFSFLSRFIPTYAGNTVFQFHQWDRCPVHPHVCGEYVNYAPPVRCVVGSSRMREIRNKIRVHPVGTSPRMRGIRALDELRESDVRGSSPRMRGIL